MNLYLDRLPENDEYFTKEASYGARLSEKIDNWPQELSSDLLRDLPFLSDYQLDVDLERVDPERGFAFGYADVSNNTERPEPEHEGAGIPHVRIPLIVEERMVRPFSVFLDGESVLPLTEERLRQTLFNPSTFDMTTSTPRDPSLIEPLTPPTRSGIGMGGEYKMASAEGANLLQKIAHTITDLQAQSFIDKLASDPSIVAGLRRAGVTDTLVEVFSQTKHSSADDHLEIISESILPTVVTLQKLPGGEFLVKQANSKAFADGKAVRGQVVSQEEASEAIGKGAAKKMSPGQSATVVADPVKDTEQPVNKSKPVEDFGEYKVQDLSGNTIMGWVFPTVLSWDQGFSEQKMALFTNGSAYAIQDAVAGELVGRGANLPSDPPRGDGVFYTYKDGEAVVTAPVTVGSTAAGPDGTPRMIATDVFGNQLQISQVDGLKGPEKISDSEYALPSDWKFMRLNNQTQLVASPQEMGKTAAVKGLQDSVTLFYNGGYHLTGGCGLNKIAKDLYQDMDPVSAEFMLGVLGVDGVTAKQKVAAARKAGSVKLAGLHTIVTVGERYAESVKTASAFMGEIPNLRRDLIKEAAALQEDSTVNNVLALNFINPENLGTFVSSIPQLEETSERLAEMLLFSYLGMNEIPSEAAGRAMHFLEEVIEGLKALGHARGK